MGGGAAGALMRHFSDLRPIDRLGDQAEFSLSRGACLV
jgi:hypothetical protein